MGCRRRDCCGGSACGLAGGRGQRRRSPCVRTVPTFPHGYIEYSLAPSAQASDSIRVGNDGDTAGTFNLVAVDGFTSTLSGVVYGDASNPLHDGPQGNGLHSPVSQ